MQNGRLVLILAADCCSWVDDVSEHHARPEEYIVFTLYARIDGNIVLYFAVFAEYDFGGYNYVLTYVAVFSNTTS